MYGENNSLRAQLRGRLFELALIKLLESSDFTIVDPVNEMDTRVKESRDGFIEFKGRGCWHQIDLPFDYKRVTPFSYPMRLLGEAKFYKTEISKKYIREYIGVLKDIQENYFVEDGDDIKNLAKRRIEVGSYFSANGFQAEAEKLAYAHGIRTISYKNNFAVKMICDAINILEDRFISVSWIQNGNWREFKSRLMHFFNLSGNDFQQMHREVRHLSEYFDEGCESILEDLKRNLDSIQSSFIGTTETGFLLHFVGFDRFPDELFIEGDDGHCRVYYDIDRETGSHYFWIEFTNDYRRVPSKFYFSPPESLDDAAVFGGRRVLQEKREHFRKLYMAVNINGVARNLVITMDNNWLDEVERGLQ